MGTNNKVVDCITLTVVFSTEETAKEDDFNTAKMGKFDFYILPSQSNSIMYSTLIKISDYGFPSYGVIVGKTVKKDNSEVWTEEAIAVFVRDNSVSLDEIWNDCKALNCEYKSKAELESNIENNSNGYYYYYIPSTKEQGKLAASEHI